MGIERILKAFSQLSVLVVGDLMVDRYLLGEVARVSPEAPVPVVDWQSTEDRLGGAANVGLNVAALGASVHLCGVIGRDSESESFFHLMDSNGLDSALIVQSSNRPTTVKTRVIANDQHLLRIDRETTSNLGSHEQQILLNRIHEVHARRPFDVVIMQDYNKGGLPPSFIHSLVGQANDANVPVAVDPKFHNFWEYKNVQLFKPNFREVKNVLPYSLQPDLPSLSRAAQHIHEKLHCGLVLITLSEKGIFASTPDNSAIHPTRKREAADVCGAGDTVIAVAALALAIGLPPDSIAQLANLAGGQVVEKVGVVPVDLPLLRKEAKRN
ncbi:MAG TPA: carbohydrate kinase [Bacteroidetes bacterium]|nr:carbohydrate kinase [Bacteroidota bacterium]